MFEYSHRPGGNDPTSADPLSAQITRLQHLTDTPGADRKAVGYLSNP
jgi:hypothetical protein